MYMAVLDHLGGHICLLLITARRTVMGGNRGCGGWTWGAVLVVRGDGRCE